MFSCSLSLFLFCELSRSQIEFFFVVLFVFCVCLIGIKMANYCPPVPQFDSDDDWPIYLQRINQYFIAYGITDEKRKAALLLTAITSEIFRTLVNVCFPEKPEKKHSQNCAKFCRNIILRQFRFTPNDSNSTKPNKEKTKMFQNGCCVCEHCR